MRKIELFLEAFLLTVASVWAETEVIPDHSPNIVFILADDMGFGDVQGLHDRGKIPTPNLNRLAREGMSFTEAHSGSAVCTPTRYGIMTGRYCWRGRLKKRVINAYAPPLIEKGRMTVAELLHGAGYVTGCVGKWHLGMEFPTTDNRPAGRKNTDWKGKITRGPISEGFDFYYGLSGSIDMDPFIFIENDHFDGVCTTTKHFISRGPATADFEAKNALQIIGRKAVEFLDRQSADRPFFLYLPLSAPHLPVLPSDAFKGRTGLGDYADVCAELDHVVGNVLRKLDQKGLSEKTIVIFTADNGCDRWVAGLLEGKGHFASERRRGYKCDIYDGGHRIPCLVRWPGHVKAGGKTAEPICLTDFMATCADLLGLSLPNDAAEDSVSALPLLLGKPYRSPREAIVHHSLNGYFAIRRGDWVLALCRGDGAGNEPRTSGKTPPVQLYNVKEDPGQTRNVQASHPEIVRQLRALLRDYRKSGRSVPERKCRQREAGNLRDNDPSGARAGDSARRLQAIGALRG